MQSSPDITVKVALFEDSTAVVGLALNDEVGANQAEDLADEIDSRLSAGLPLQPHVFIDPTQAPSPAEHAAPYHSDR